MIEMHITLFHLYFSHSDASINLTLWNADADNFNDYGQPVLLVKGGRIGEFGGGKSIAMVGSTVLKKNPDLNFLRGWFDNGGGRNTQNSQFSIMRAIGLKNHGTGNSYLSDGFSENFKNFLC